MKKIICVFKVLLLSIFTSSLLGCVAFSFSRLTEPHSAQTLGEGNNEVEVSSGSLGGLEDKDALRATLVPLFSSSIKYTRGLSDNFDLAVFVETQFMGIIPLIGLEGKYQLTSKEKHTLSLLFGAGINKGVNEYSMDSYDAEQYEDEVQYKKIANDPLLGYFSYLGPVYSFKPNKKYELALNIRINQSYSQVAPRTANEMAQDLGRAFGTAFAQTMATVITLGAYNPGEDDAELETKYSAIKSSASFLYGSANMSHTWWVVPSFGATASLGIMYPFYFLGKNNKSEDEDEDELELLMTKLGLNLHFNF